MFREMRRHKQALPKAQCLAILKNEPRGVLAVSGDDGYPYALPMSHCYDERTGTLVFHCAQSGHKLDAIRRNDKVSFCVYDKGTPIPDDWALRFNCVIVFGRMRLVEDPARAMEICRLIGGKFAPTQEETEDEIRKHFSHVQCMELEIEHISGKTVTEK